MQFKFEVMIDAATEEEAEQVREEVVGSIEDWVESERPSYSVWASDMQQVDEPDTPIGKGAG